MPRRNRESNNTVGAVAQLLGVVLLVLGSVHPIGQLAMGVRLAEVEWLLFVIVSGFGFGMIVVGPAFGRRYQAAGEPQEIDGDNLDGGGGDVGD